MLAASRTVEQQQLTIYLKFTWIFISRLCEFFAQKILLNLFTESFLNNFPQTIGRVTLQVKQDPEILGSNFKFYTIYTKNYSKNFYCLALNF